MKSNITILGAGAWGSAVAQLFSDNGHAVTLWSHEPDVVEAINSHHCNSKYLPDIQLPTTIIATTDLKEALESADLIAEATPVMYLRAVLQQVKAVAGEAAAKKRWLILSKGIEQETFMLPTQILDDVFRCHVTSAVLSGPSFARDLVARQPTVVQLASRHEELAGFIRACLKNSYFATVYTQDVTGVQVGGAFKNVMALGVGMAQGFGYGENTKAFLVTQALSEISQLSYSLGGQESTVYSLAGLGDLVLTTTSTTSKNFKAGVLLGQGIKLAQLTDHLPVLPEGINTLKVAYALMHRLRIPLPLVNLVYHCVMEDADFKELFTATCAQI